MTNQITEGKDNTVLTYIDILMVCVVVWGGVCSPHTRRSILISVADKVWGSPYSVVEEIATGAKRQRTQVVLQSTLTIQQL